MTAAAAHAQASTTVTQASRGGIAAAQQEFAETGYLTPEWGRLVIEADGSWAGRVAITDSTNIGEQRALERAGFTREGVLRGCQRRRGQWHDQLVYSRLRDDPVTATD